MRLVIVEDEYKELKRLKAFAARLSSVSVVGGFVDPLQAIGFLKNNEIDGLLLDTLLPHVDTSTFLTRLERPIKTVLLIPSPAAFKSISSKHIVGDLIKPFSFPQFVKAIIKLESS